MIKMLNDESLHTSLSQIAVVGAEVVGAVLHEIYNLYKECTGNYIHVLQIGQSIK